MPSIQILNLGLRET
nr:unnamed protein product [Callosobruchus chinensis]